MLFQWREVFTLFHYFQPSSFSNFQWNVFCVICLQYLIDSWNWNQKYSRLFYKFLKKWPWYAWFLNRRYFDFLHYLICNNPSLPLTTDLIPLSQRLTLLFHVYVSAGNSRIRSTLMMIPCNSVNVCCGHLECSSLDLSGTRPVDFFTRFVFCASKPQQLRFVLLPLCAATGRKHCASFSQFGIDFKTCSFCYILDINMKLIWGLLYYNLHTYSSICFRTMTWQKNIFYNRLMLMRQQSTK